MDIVSPAQLTQFTAELLIDVNVQLDSLLINMEFV